MGRVRNFGFGSILSMFFFEHVPRISPRHIGHMCRITTLRENFPLGKKWGIKLQRICKMALHG